MPFRLEERNNFGGNPARSGQRGGGMLVRTIDAKDGGVWSAQPDDKRFAVNIDAVVLIGHASSKWLDGDALGVSPGSDTRHNLAQQVRHWRPASLSHGRASVYQRKRL
jgi:hypothetical protein